MEEKSKLKKLWEHLVSVMKVTNKNPTCGTCFSPIMDENGSPVVGSVPKGKEE